MREVGTRLDPHLREEDVPLLRRQMEAVRVIAAPPFADSAVPALTADPEDGPIPYTALLADADLLTSSDERLVPDRKEELWGHEARTVLALTFETLLADRLGGVDWDEIDGAWLALAYDDPD